MSKNILKELNEVGLGFNINNPTEIGIPGMDQKTTKEPINIFKDFVVRIFKGDLEEPGDILFLQTLRTEALKGSNDLVIFTTNTFTFQTSYFMVVEYAVRKGCHTFLAEYGQSNTGDDVKIPNTDMQDRTGKL